MSDQRDLTDRMRTCAAYLLARKNDGEPWAVEIVSVDAADLLVEASNLLAEKIPAEPLGAPMEIIPPQHPVRAESHGDPLWIAPGGKLPGLSHSGTVSPRACPQCDSRTTKKVRRVGKRLMLECPVCAKEWPWQGAAA